MTLTHDEMLEFVSNPSSMNGNTFDVFRQLCDMSNSDDESANLTSRDFVIRLLNSQDDLPTEYHSLLNSLVRVHGLYPYLNPLEIGGLADLLAYESNRPFGLESEDIVFHQVQTAVYQHLLDGDNVILSAPTSFGKSLIIDALIASGQFQNIVIIVPTIALIDETRRRLSERFGRSFKINTHPSQRMDEKNIFIYTQERVVDHERFPSVDLFIIDEFYKLNGSDVERTGLLNQALYRLLKSGAQFYLLGPNIEQVAPQFISNFNARFFHTDYSTVSIDVKRVAHSRGSDLEALLELCNELTEPTLIYCRSPRQTRDVAKALLAASWLAAGDQTLHDAADWMSEAYHPDWLPVQALRSGLGVHNGRIPRWLAQFTVRAFNEDRLRFLICTSTLIEGVNTKAKNVIIFDNKIANQRFDYFTFNNIRGRSGRMFYHYVGHVYLFHDPPPAHLPTVDIPAVTQPSDTPRSLLVQMDEDDLTEESQERLEPILNQDDLSIEVIRANKGIDPTLQIEVARQLRRSAAQLHPVLSWSGFPNGEQLRATCGLAWQLSGFRGRTSGVSSGNQLALKIQRLNFSTNMAEFIHELSRSDRDTPDGDQRVENAFEFVRQWAGHHAPRLLMGVHRIQQEVFNSLNRRPGNYTFYVAQVQNLFLPIPLASVDEFGLPVDVAQKIAQRLTVNGDLDDLLSSIARLDVSTLGLASFELELLRDVRRSLAQLGDDDG